MPQVQGNPQRGLIGATAGFFVGFAAVALFGSTAAALREAMGLTPVQVGVLIAVPSLSGSLLRIPFSAWVDTSGGRKPFLTLLALSACGMAGLLAVLATYYPSRMSPELYPAILLLALLSGCGIATFSVGAGQVAYWYPRAGQGVALALFAGIGNLAPGVFSMLIPFALTSLGLVWSYALWLALLLAGLAYYWVRGSNAWYFQLRQAGMSEAEARGSARGMGQELFPKGDLKQSLLESGRTWQTWTLVLMYFTTFGGFIALTAWFPTYWTQFFGLAPIYAGLLTALFSLLTSSIRIAGGILADRLREGGENTAVLGLLIMMAGALVMVNADQYELAIPGCVLLGSGMGISNAAVFKLAPQAVPHAIGGAVGWVGGLGALGGFLIPPAMGFAVSDLGNRGFAIGFIIFIYLCLASMTAVWVLKYIEAKPASADEYGESELLTGRGTGKKV